MYRHVVAIIFALMVSYPAWANDWEKFYRATPTTISTVPSEQPPEVINFEGNLNDTINAMWRNGYTPIGFSAFNSPNSKTMDAVKFATRLKARYVAIATALTSSSIMNLPITTPTTATTISNGTVSAYGGGGSAQGTYSGTSTTYGSQTSYIPIVKNRFDKIALYFAPVKAEGVGIAFRELTTDEMQRYDTRHAMVVRAVRKGSPADSADVLDGDVFLSVNGQNMEQGLMAAAARSSDTLKVHLIRNGQARDLTIDIPLEWRPK